MLLQTHPLASLQQLNSQLSFQSSFYSEWGLQITGMLCSCHDCTLYSSSTDIRGQEAVDWLEIPVDKRKHTTAETLSWEAHTIGGCCSRQQRVCSFLRAAGPGSRGAGNT